MNPILTFIIGLVVGALLGIWIVMIYAKYMTIYRPAEKQALKQIAEEKWKRKNANNR